MAALVRVARAGAVLQLALVAGVTAAFFAMTVGSLWHDSRPGCVVDEVAGSGTEGLVVCGTSSADPVLGWAAALVGVAVALVVARSSGRSRQVAQVAVLLVSTAGTASFTADKARFGGVSAAICIVDGRGGCAHPAWTWTSLVVGAGVGLALGIVSLAGEQMSRRATAPLGWRRVVRASLLVVSVLTALLALWARLALGDTAESTPWWYAAAAAALLVVGLAVGPRPGRLERTRAG